MEKLDPLHNIWQFLKKLDMHNHTTQRLHFWAFISGMKTFYTHTHTNLHTNVYSSFFVTAINEQQPRRPSVGEWLNYSTFLP